MADDLLCLNPSCQSGIDFVLKQFLEFQGGGFGGGWSVVDWFPKGVTMALPSNLILNTLVFTDLSAGD